MPSEYFLEMSRISKTFSGVKVLDDIDFNIKPGEIRALVGENGAGKSTLMKILGGIYQRDKNSGSIKINGTAVDINSAADATRLGISIIHQEIHLADNMSVYDNMFMGSELLMAHDLFLDDNAMIRKAQIVIDDMGMDLDVREKVKDLSIARQQMVEISRSLLSDAKLIVMDEPTSSLTENEIEQLFSQIRKLKSTGIAIIYISHRMPEIFKLSDTITVLRDGQLIGTDLTSNLDERSVISMMVGREISEIYGLKPNTSSEVWSRVLCTPWPGRRKCRSRPRGCVIRSFFPEPWCRRRGNRPRTCSDMRPDGPAPGPKPRCLPVPGSSVRTSGSRIHWSWCPRGLDSKHRGRFFARPSP